MKQKQYYNPNIIYANTVDQLEKELTAYGGNEELYFYKGVADEVLDDNVYQIHDTEQHTQVGMATVSNNDSQVTGYNTKLKCEIILFNQFDITIVHSLLDLLTKFKEVIKETNKKILKGIEKYGNIDDIVLFDKNRNIIAEIVEFEHHIKYMVNNNFGFDIIELCDKREAEVKNYIINMVSDNHVMNSTSEIENLRKIWEIENVKYLTGIYKFVTVWYVSKPEEFPIPNSLYHGSNR